MAFVDPKLSDYENKYENFKLERTDGILQITVHTDGGKAVLGQRILKHFILVGVCVRWIAVKIQNDRRVLDSLRLQYVKVHRISPSPL